MVGDIVSAPEIARCWRSPSCLPGFSVGGLAGHAYLAARIVDRQLDRPLPEGSRIRRPGEYYAMVRVDEHAQLGDPVHRTIRGDGEYVARRGPDALAAKFTELVAGLRRRLAAEPAGRLTACWDPGLVARLDDFLANRSAELLVHADDLMASSGMRPIDFPPHAASVAISHLVAVARERAGDVQVLRALSGRDRPALEQLRVL
jgi:hypothetical protein